MQDNVTQTDARGMFKGSNEQLCNSIDALLDLNHKGAVAHRVPGMAVALLEAAHARLASTTAQTEAVQKLVDALEAWEAWEAKWLLDDACWQGDQPAMSCELHDEYVASVQALRVTALAAHRESQP